MDDLFALLEQQNEKAPSYQKTTILDPSLSVGELVEKKNELINSSCKSIRKSNAGGSGCNNEDIIANISLLTRKISQVVFHDRVSLYDFKSLPQVMACTTSMAEECSGNIYTVGIVISNSGTLISRGSQKGFSKVQLSTFLPNTRSLKGLVSIMLFGDAYTKYVTSLRIGTVVTVVGAHFMPQNKNFKSKYDEPKKTLKVIDEEQLMIVGQARYMGVCKGVSYRSRRSCKECVDMRLGNYCDEHRNQQQLYSNSKSSSQQSRSTNGNSLGGLSRDIRSDIQQNGVSGGFRHILQKKDGYKAPYMPEAATFPRMNHHRPALPLKDLASNKSALSQKVHSAKQQSGVHIPRSSAAFDQMLFQSIPKANTVQNINITTSGAILNKNDEAVTSRNDVLGNALSMIGKKRERQPLSHFVNQTKTKSQHEKQQKSRLGFAAEGLDGSVYIPKPSRALFGSAQQGIGHVHISTKSTFVADTSTSEAEKLALRHKHIAQKLRGINDLPSNIQKSRLLTPTEDPSKENKDKNNKMDLLFGSLQVDKDIVMASSSLFSSEAEAEEFARTYVKLSELEQKETVSDTNKASKKKNNASASNGRLYVEYYCRTCDKRTPFKPLDCMRMDHNVRKHRKIKDKEVNPEVAEKVKKSGEAGKMIVGSGIEWNTGRRYK